VKNALYRETNKLKQARYSIGVAMGEEKYSGILGALRGNYINCLVTTAAELLLINKYSEWSCHN
jgi:DNA-binding transcriptional regulator LsrR (DeoR family)